MKCDCPVYRSAPNVCQHALAATEDLHNLSDYLLWLRRTKKGVNVSQLISISVPKDAGKKPSSKCKGAAKAKRKVSEEVSTVPLSFTGSTPSQDHFFLYTRSSSIADMVDFDREKSAAVPYNFVLLISPCSSSSSFAAICHLNLCPFLNPHCLFNSFLYIWVLIMKFQFIMACITIIPRLPISFSISSNDPVVWWNSLFSLQFSK